VILPKLPSFCMAHSGADPIWHGRPTRRMVRFINALTKTDQETGKRYYVTANGLTPLRTAADFADLNRILDEARRG
jgi:hypothetical protein